MRGLISWGTAAALMIFSTLAYAQSQTVRQSGPVTSNHASCWATVGVIQDCGTSDTPGVSTFGLYGTGTPLCILNTQITTAQYYKLCMGYTTGSTAGVISLTPFGGAPNIPLDIDVSGVIIPIGGANWLSSVLDQQFGSTPGDIICRGVTLWSALGAGPVGQVLTSNSTNGCPQWTIPGGTTTPTLRAVTSGTTDTALTTDGTIAWKSASASGKTETLYACNNGNNGKLLYIKDAQGTAATYPITIAPNGSDNIDGGAVYVMAFNYQAVTIQCYAAASQWLVL